jgi:2-keto-4-pentenoate hydratase
MMLDISHLATRQLRDYDAHSPGTVFAEQVSLSEEQAYAVQAEVCRLREQRGELVIGYKVGCTSPGIQLQLGIDHPVFGYLFDSDSWTTGITLPSSRFAGLAIEGELAVRLARDIPAADLSKTQLSDAIESVFAVIELHNFIIRRGEPSAAELIANNAIHAGFVYATDPSSTLHSDPKTLRIELDDVEVATVCGTKLTCTILESLNWLADELTRHRKELRAGQTILCGSIADLIPVSDDCRIAVVTDQFGSVNCTIQQTDENSGASGRPRNGRSS